MVPSRQRLKLTPINFQSASGTGLPELPPVVWFDAVKQTFILPFLPYLDVLNQKKCCSESLNSFKTAFCRK